MSVITLTSDFGSKDYVVAAVKGRLLNLPDRPIIVDISHEITHFSITETAYLLNAAYPNFPKNSIHLIGVDSEKNPKQRHLIAYLNGHYFIGADNGIFSLLADQDQFDTIIEIQHPKSDQSSFPMLEVFVEIAAKIITDEKLENLGKPTDEIKKWIRNKPDFPSEDVLIGHIVYVDRYGNLVTDISREIFETIGKDRPFEIYASNKKLTKIYQNYSSFVNFKLPEIQRKKAGKALAIFNSLEMLEIALYKSNPKQGGSASDLLGLTIGNSIKIIFEN